MCTANRPASTGDHPNPGHKRQDIFTAPKDFNAAVCKSCGSNTGSNDAKAIGRVGRKASATGGVKINVTDRIPNSGEEFGASTGKDTCYDTGEDSYARETRRSCRSTESTSTSAAEKRYEDRRTGKTEREARASGRKARR